MFSGSGWPIFGRRKGSLKSMCSTDEISQQLDVGKEYQSDKVLQNCLIGFECQEWLVVFTDIRPRSKTLTNCHLMSMGKFTTGLFAV